LKSKGNDGLSLEGIVNGVVLGNRNGVSALVEGALGWAMSAARVKMSIGDELRQKEKELKKIVVKGFFHSFCPSPCGKGVTEGGVIEHARRNDKGKGWWKNGCISIGLIHNGGWLCLHMEAVEICTSKVL
jgi:hypothetical protein